ncbi:MAG: D-amino acid aminotransferase [Burkholderiaceae bacterium]
MSSEQIVYLNGEFLPLDEAKVPVLDRGFIFGDGIYEVVPAYGGRLFRWPHHYARLERSLKKIGIDNPMPADAWTRVVEDLIARHPWADQFVYLHITRGVAKRDHAFPKGVAPTVFAMSSPLTLPTQAVREAGIDVITLPDVRWLHCDIKSISLLGNVLARQAAADAGALECIQFRDGFMTEGSSSNVWIARGGQVFGAVPDNRILEGIRVGLMGELCEDAGLALTLRPVLREEVLAADEVMVTSATKEILPVARIDGKPVGSGRPGPVFAALYDAYQRAKARHG